jgi:transposase-like protein
MSGFGGKLGPKKEAAILALLSSQSVEDAARDAGVTPRTLFRWMKEPEFEAALRAARRAAFSQSIGRLQQMGIAAVTILGKVMVDPNTPPATKVRAADSVLNHAAKAIETEDILARVAELERARDASDDRRRFGVMGGSA